MEEALIRVFLRQNAWWGTKEVPAELKQKFERPKVAELMEYLELDRMLVLLGARRVGKTTIMHQMIDRLISKGVNVRNIMYCRLDDPIINKHPLTDVIEAYRQYKQPEGTAYLFLDEIQHMKEWDLWLKTLYDQKENMKIIVSGSASVQLKKQSESLYGRSLEFVIHPFSFFEFALFMYKDKNKLLDLRKKMDFERLNFNVSAEELIECGADMAPLLSRYLVIGGFPEIFQIKDMAKAYYALRDDVMNKAIYHDIVTLFNVKEPQLVEALMTYLAANSARILNKDGLSKDLGSPKPTTYAYLDYVKRAFLAGSAKNYSRSAKKMLRTMEKWYVSDAGIMNMLNYKDESLLSDGVYLGQVAETIVLNHLLAFAEKKNYRLAYWRDRSKAEVDAVLDMRKSLVPIEVKYQSKISDSDIKWLLKFMEKFRANSGMVVTRNLLKKEEIKGKEIFFVPLWVFLTAL